MEPETDILEPDPTVPPEPLEVTKARWQQVVLALFLCFVPAWLTNIYNYSINFNTSTPFYGNYVAIIYDLPVAAALLFIAYNNKWTAAQLGLDKLKWQHLGFGVATCLLGVIASTLADGLQQILIMQFLPDRTIYEDFPPILPIILPILVVSLILNSLVEEISFRGIIETHLPILTKSPIFGIVISALLFSSYHIYQGWDALFPAFVFGISMSISRKIFESIWPAIIGHTISNLISTMGWMNFLPG